MCQFVLPINCSCAFRIGMKIQYIDKSYLLKRFLEIFVVYKCNSEVKNICVGILIKFYLKCFFTIIMTCHLHECPNKRKTLIIIICTYCYLTNKYKDTLNLRQ